ncbi:MAG: serine hydrolase [Candidatus Lindowbacteria bacterium]|nr:serine hydrolase [Candidatus Lindowbacteria bacterium]
MKNILLLILTLIVNISFAQTEKPENKIVAEKFVESYNNNDYEAIFSMFAEVMQNALPIDKTTEFLSGLKAQAGNITNREFVKYENGSFASYKTIFERAVFSLNISIDNNSKINGLLVKPFVEENNSENVINNLSKNELITKEQSEIIFNKVKSFPNNTQISIAIIRNGKVSYYGVKQNNDTILSIENYRSIFEIGSISKIFTSTLLAGCITDKKIKLNDNINGFLNLAFNNGTKTSFKELANHTSGLPALPTNLDLTAVNPKNPYKEYNKTDLDEYLTKNIELSNKGVYQYSNLGAGLLGYTLSKISNVSYDSLLYSKIFSKYNMLNSTTSFNKIKGNLIKGLDNKGNEVSNWEFSVLAGAGGILSNVEDLAKFAIAQFDYSNKELKLTRKKTFEVNENMDIGLGWHILKSQSENIWNWHNGGTGGYSSSMVIDTKNKNGIVILSNVSAFNPNMKNIDKLCFELMKTLEKK